jgi:uncharacterized protein (TIGR03084 family)
MLSANKIHPQMNINELCDDLLAERTDLIAVVERLDEHGWREATPAPGWSVLDQVVHLAWFDDAARQAIVEPDPFRSRRGDVISDVDGFVDRIAKANRDRSGPDILAWLRRAGDGLVSAAEASDPSIRVPWYGPDMSLASMLTARIMETWAHGQDIFDTFGLSRTPTQRLRHVVFLGWKALPNSFRAHGRPVPQEAVRIEVGEWKFGPDDASNVVRGPALDFCLVVTQRRHPADTALVTEGTVAADWLTIAQAFAGPPGEGRRPGQFAERT